MSWPAPAAYLFWKDSAGGSNYLAFDQVQTEEDDENATVTEHPVEVGADVADHVKIELVEIRLKVRSTNEPIPMANPAISAAAQPGDKIWGSGQQAGQLVPLEIQVTSTPEAEIIESITIPTWVNNITARALLKTATGAIGSAAGGGVGGAIGSAAGGLLGALLFAPTEQDVTFTPQLAGVPVFTQTTISAQTYQWPAGTDYVASTHALLVQLKNSAQVFTVFLSKGGEYDSMVIEKLSFMRSSDTGSGEDITIGLKQVLIVTTQTVAAPIPHLSAGGAKPTVNKGAASAVPAPAVSALKNITTWGSSLYQSLFQ